MKIKIYKSKNQYHYSLEDGSTKKNSKPYLNSWSAYRGAIRCAQNNPLYNPNFDPMIGNYEESTNKVNKNKIYSDEYIVNYYQQIYANIYKETRNIDSWPLKESILEEHKIGLGSKIDGVIKELETLLEKIEDEQKSEINKLKSNFEKIKSQLNLKEKEVVEEDMDMLPMGDFEDMGAISSAKNKMRKFAKMGNADLSKKEKDELLEDIGDKVCEYLSKFHKDILFTIGHDHKHLSIIDALSREKILRLYFDEHLMLNRIYPLGSLKDIFPINSHEFYQRYFKPIVQIVGFLHLPEHNSLIVPDVYKLPNIPGGRNSVVELGCWDTKAKKYDVMELSFKDDGVSGNWFFKKPNIVTASSNGRLMDLSKDELLSGDILVKCIDENLKTIYGKVGNIEQIIESGPELELDVNFGRHIVRLRHDQLEVVDGLRNL